MPMTLVVTRDVADRTRGFLASAMPELAPGVYVAPDLSKAVRERIWAVISEWWGARPVGSVVMAWRDSAQISGLAVATLGLPPVRLAELDGLLVVHRDLAAQEAGEDDAPPYPA